MKSVLKIVSFLILLSVSLSACTIVFDDTRGWPGDIESTDYDSLKLYLGDLGKTCITLTDSFFIPPQCNILVIRCGEPDSIFSDSEISAIQNFVYKGGILVAIAEHGLWSIGRYSNEVNRILSDSVGWHTGLRFRKDAVFDTEYYYLYTSAPKIFAFEYHPYTSDLDTVMLGLSPSISIEYPARPLTWGSSSSFTIDSSYADTCYSCRDFFAISHFGLGVILAVPDYSVWLYRSSISWLDYYDNKLFAENAFSCSSVPRFTFNPPANGVVSCFERDTLWWEVSVANYGAIDTSILVVSINGMRITPGPSFEILDDTSFAVRVTDYITLTHGESVWVCIDSIADVDSFFPFDSFCYPILIDHMPPAITAFYPSPDTSLDWFDSISVSVIDSIAGLDTSSLIFMVNSDTFYLDDPLISFDNGKLTLHLDAADSLFAGDTLISLSLFCCDMPDVCEPNCFEYNWGFVSDYVGIAEAILPKEIVISAYPNPFNSSVRIGVESGELRVESVEIYDVNGRRVDVIARSPQDDAAISSNKTDCFVANASRNDGMGEFVWHPDPSLGSGVYLVLAKNGDCVLSKRIVYLK